MYRAPFPMKITSSIQVSKPTLVVTDSSIQTKSVDRFKGTNFPNGIRVSMFGFPHTITKYRPALDEYKTVITVQLNFYLTVRHLSSKRSSNILKNNNLRLNTRKI